MYSRVGYRHNHEKEVAAIQFHDGDYFVRYRKAEPFIGSAFSILYSYDCTKVNEIFTEEWYNTGSDLSGELPWII